ncbi:MAG: hypothetical protein M3O71_17150 [Bacteroidota bacterium]|nr:hypothetical protein [Bacteroidota bacterium]
MKIVLLTLSTLFIITSLSAQKIELSVQANTGLFHYGGKSTTTTSAINQGPSEQSNYTNNPFGSKNGFGYGGALQAQFVSNNGFILGLQTGYETLKSKVDITRINVYYNPDPFPDPSNDGPVIAKGESYLKTQFITLNPYIGYRLNFKKVKLDLMPGLDIAFASNTHENAKAVGTTNNTTYQTNLKRDNNVSTDLRLRFGAAAMYKRYGITASFAHGFTNYEKGIIGDGSYEAHSELLRFGVLYRIL